jgi:hypothetical protein
MSEGWIMDGRKGERPEERDCFAFPKCLLGVCPLPQYLRVLLFPVFIYALYLGGERGRWAWLFPAACSSSIELSIEFGSDLPYENEEKASGRGEACLNRSTSTWQETASSVSRLEISCAVFSVMIEYCCDE